MNADETGRERLFLRAETVLAGLGNGQAECRRQRCSVVDSIYRSCCSISSGQHEAATPSIVLEHSPNIIRIFFPNCYPLSPKSRSSTVTLISFATCCCLLNEINSCSSIHPTIRSQTIVRLQCFVRLSTDCGQFGMILSLSLPHFLFDLAPPSQCITA